MQFDSLTFSFFLLFISIAYHLLPSWTGKKYLLLLASYLFYAAWRPPLAFLLLFTTATNWLLARLIEESSSRKTRFNWMATCLFINLGLLGYFKYANLLLGSISQLTIWFIPEVDIPILNIVLPIGISFYTFQALSYTIDVYRKELRASASFLDFSIYVSFFPQLVAGPIVRAAQFLPQLARERTITQERFSRGLILFIFGIFAKTVLADSLLAPIVDTLYAQSAPLGTIDSLAAIFAFTGQIYFDFSGYTNCALGLAIIFGFTLPENFRAPYAAAGISDFWRRWHISLSTWLRDYLYISLGGNRKGIEKTARNLLITMVLGGLWHGAAWNFVIWGLFHGILLMTEYILLLQMPRLRNYLGGITSRILTFVLISSSWVFFRAESLAKVNTIFGGLCALHLPPLFKPSQYLLLISITIVMFIWQQWTRKIPAYRRYAGMSLSQRCLVLTVALIGIYLASKGDSRAFLYFQF